MRGIIGFPFIVVYLERYVGHMGKNQQHDKNKDPKTMGAKKGIFTEVVILDATVFIVHILWNIYLYSVKQLACQVKYWA